jgi:C-terminal processing protease CtpA/Prc
VGNALKNLSAKGMKRLVFDLRDNPGGPRIRRSRSEPLPAEG